MKTYVLFFLLFSTSINLWGQKTGYYHLPPSSIQARTMIREIEQHNRILQRAVRGAQAKHTATVLCGSRMTKDSLTQQQLRSLLAIRNFQPSGKSIPVPDILNMERLKRLLSIHHVDSTHLESTAIDTTVVDTLPWFKPYVRRRLPHGVD